MVSSYSCFFDALEPILIVVDNRKHADKPKRNGRMKVKTWIRRTMQCAGTSSKIRVAAASR
jgi:hypothetical protein